MTKRLYGFAAMTPERRKEIAAMGGAAVPDSKRSFSKDRYLASKAGRIGGMAGKRQPKENDRG